MKVAVISDIHDNLVNLKKFLSWCAENSIEKIICCGDVTNGDTLGVLANHPPLYKRGDGEKFLGDIYLVRGNMEIYDEDEVAAYPNIIYGGRQAGHGLSDGRTAVWEIGGKKIGVCHEPFLIKELFGKEKKLDIIFYGHTHKPWIEDRGGTLIVNPGTLGGVFSRATFAVYDTERSEPELKLLDNL